MATRLSNAPSAKATEMVDNAAIGTKSRARLLQELKETLEKKERTREIAEKKRGAAAGDLAEELVRHRAAVAELREVEEDIERIQWQAERDIRAAVTTEEVRRLEVLGRQIIFAENAVQEGNLGGSQRLIDRANKRLAALRAAAARAQNLHLEPGPIIAACDEIAETLKLPDVAPPSAPPPRYAQAEID